MCVSRGIVSQDPRSYIPPQGISNDSKQLYFSNCIPLRMLGDQEPNTIPEIKDDSSQGFFGICYFHFVSPRVILPEQVLLYLRSKVYRVYKYIFQLKANLIKKNQNAKAYRTYRKISAVKWEKWKEIQSTNLSQFLYTWWFLESVTDYMFRQDVLGAFK